MTLFFQALNGMGLGYFRYCVIVPDLLKQLCFPQAVQLYRLRFWPDSTGCYTPSVTEPSYGTRGQKRLD